MKKNCHQEKHTHKVHSAHNIDPSIPIFFMGKNLVKIQLEKYDFKLLCKKKKKIMEKVTQIRQNLKKTKTQIIIFL